MSDPALTKVEGQRHNAVDLSHHHFRIWNLVNKTDEQYVKGVKYGDREFSAIDPYYQIRLATAAFGPMGEGFGLSPADIQYLPMTKTGKKTIEGYQIYGRFVFWAIIPKPQFKQLQTSEGMKVEHVSDDLVKIQIELMNDIFSGPNDEASKKIFTDTLTKALSFLGFNNDVFMGSFKGNKYVGGVDDAADPADQEELKKLLARAEELGIINAQTRRASIATHANKKWEASGVESDIAKLTVAIEKKEKANADAAPVDSGPPADEAEEGEG